MFYIIYVGESGVTKFLNNFNIDLVALAL